MEKLKVFDFDRLVVDRGEDGIENDFKHFVDHVGDEALDKFVWGTDVGVIIDFYQPGSEVLVDEKVKPEKLKLLFLHVSEKPFLK